MAIIDELIGVLGFDFTGDEALNRYERGLSRAGKLTDNFVKSAGRIASWGGAIVGAFTGFQSVDVLKTSGEFERFGLILETIEGSSEKAGESLDWVANFAKKTPYDLAGVTDAFVKLKAYGIDPVTGDALKILGDTASAMGKPLNQAVEMFADASTMEFERLKEFGIKAKQQGDEVTFAWSENGQEVTRTVKKNTAEIQSFLLERFGSRFSGAMDKQSEGFFGLLANIGDFWSNFQRKIGEKGYFDEAKVMLKDFLDLTDRLEADGTLDMWAQSISNAFTFMLRLGRTVFDRLFTHITFLTNVVRDNAEWFDKWGSTIGAVFAMLVARLFPVTTILTGLVLVIDDFLTYLEGGESYIGRFIDWLQAIIPVSDGVGLAIGGIGATLITFLLPLLASMPFKIAGLFSRVMFWSLTSLLPRAIAGGIRLAWRYGIKGLGGFLGRMLMVGLRSLGGWVLRGLLALAPFVAKGVAGAFALLSNPIGWAVLAAMAVGALVWYFWDELVQGWNWLGTQASALFATVGQWWSDVGGLIGIGKLMFTALWAGIVSVWNSIWSWGTGLMSKILQWWDDIGGIRGAGETLFNAYWEALKAVWGQIGEWAGGLLDGLIFLFTGKDTDFASAGRNAINAFFDGLKSIGNQIIDWFWSIIPEPLRNFLQGTAEGIGGAIDAGGEFLGNAGTAISEGASEFAGGVKQSVADVGAWWDRVVPEISEKITANLLPNLTQAQGGEEAVKAVVNDERVDTRDQSTNIHAETHVHQSVTQAVEAPARAAEATGAAIQRTVPARAMGGAG